MKRYFIFGKNMEITSKGMTTTKNPLICKKCLECEFQKSALK